MIQLTDKQAELRATVANHRHVLGVGGSRSGKTFGFCYFIDRRAQAAPGSRHLIYRKHAVAAKQAIGMDTLPKIHHLTGDPKPRWYSQDGLFLYPNGAEVWLAGLDSANLDKVLGKEYATLYPNEASEIPFQIREQTLTRLAQSIACADGVPLNLKEFCDLNPTTTAHWTYKLWIEGVNPVSEKPIDRALYGYLFLNPHDNRANLPPAVFETLEGMSERQRRRFLLGEYTADVEHALWRRSMIQRLQETPGPMDRIVIGVDPAISSDIGSDETGVVAIGRKGDATNRRGYVLEDASGKFRPEEWARVAIALYHEMKADCIVAEANQGGDMVESVIRAMEAQMGRSPARVKLVHATKGKGIRAEPIAALYERKLMFHVGEFPQLEDQMCFVAGTLIETARGQVPIENVAVGDLAVTRGGLRKVKVARETGKAYSVVDIECADGRSITCTETHPIFVMGKFVPARLVKAGDILLGSRNWAVLGGQLLGAGNGITEQQAVILGTPKGTFCTERFGSLMSGVSRKVTTYITRVVIRATTGLKTLSVSARPNTLPATIRAVGRQLEGHQSSGANHGKTGNGTKQNVGSAATCIQLRFPLGRDIVATLAASALGRLKKWPAKRARIAETILRPETQGENIAVARVTTRRITPASVYNLEVEGDPEYFANGILVHNCTFTVDFNRKAQGYSPDRLDALVWAATELFPAMAVSNAVNRRPISKPKARFF